MNRKTVERPAGRSMLVRYPAMPSERPNPEPLDYAARRPRMRATRGRIVALVGASAALIGALVFICAHKLTGTDYDTIVAEHARLQELLWALFGIALLLAGALIAAVGLRSWCGSDAG